MRNEIIHVNGLAATFGKNKVLKEVSFSAYENEITVILGTSGCGKTTVLKHLIGLYPVQHGDRLTLADVELRILIPGATP